MSAVREARIGMLVFAPDGAVLAVNFAFCDMSGYEEKELIGMKPPYAFLEEGGGRGALLLPPDGEIRSRWIEFMLRRADGSMAVVYACRFPADPPGGGSFFLFMDPRDNGSGRERSLCRRIAGEYLSAQRPEGMAELASVIAHDLNNMVFGISGYAGLALSEAGADKKIRGDIEEIIGAADHAGEYVEKLKSLGGEPSSECTIVSAGDLLDDLRKILAMAFPPGIEMSFDLGGCEAALHISRGEIEKAFLNICLNACEAMPEGGRLAVKCRTVTINEENARSYGQITGGNYLSVLITDEGAGMDPGSRERALEPFFTTKKDGRHLGLGLPIAEAAIRRHRGAIQIYSRAGGGTTVEVLIPVGPAIP